MYLDSEKKQEIFGKYGTSNTDTGSAESQVALFSYRISHLTEHMRANRKDHTTERALVKLPATPPYPQNLSLPMNDFAQKCSLPMNDFLKSVHCQ